MQITASPTPQKFHFFASFPVRRYLCFQSLHFSDHEVGAGGRTVMANAIQLERLPFTTETATL